MNVRAVATSLITSCQHEGLECFGGFAASRFGAAVHQGGVQEWSCHVTDDGRQRGTTSPPSRILINLMLMEPGFLGLPPRTRRIR